MITISKPLSAGHAETYFEKEFVNAVQEYYASGSEIVGRWHGRLAASFGLVGDVDRALFSRLANGLHPMTGETMVRAVAPHSYVNAKGETVERMGHRAGWDAVFSAPKTVSLVALVGGDTRVRQAHRESVGVALSAIESYTQARMGGDRLPETTGRFVAATFEHDSARPVHGYAAPQLHTHAVVFNVTQTAAGLTRSLQPRELYKAQAFATAAYRAELAVRLVALGYQIDRGKSGQPDITGFSPEYLEAASPRRKQIKDYLLSHGTTGAGAAELAAQRTKDAKLHLTAADVLAAHQRMAMEYGDQPRQAVSRAMAQRHIEAQAEEPDARRAVQYAKDRNMERSAVVEDRAVLTDALKRGMGVVTLRAVSQEFQRRVTVGEFMARPSLPGAAAQSWTTPEMVALELATIARMSAGRGQYAPISTASHLSETATLNADQRASVHMILTSRDQVMALEGIAGSGKNTALSAIREAAERACFDVHGVAPTSRAAAHLADAGMPTQTLQRALALNEPSTRPRLTVLDESSLASTVLMHTFLDRMQPHDRVLLVGDIRQHQSVDAGKSYQQLQEHGLETTRLGQIVRQPDPALKAVVAQLSEGHVRNALTTLAAMGRVHEIRDRAERLDAIAREFVTGPRDTLVVAPDNASRAELNEVIHKALQAQRRVDPDHQPTPVLVARQDLTGVDRGYADRYDVGDVVRYTKGSVTYGLARGEYATVTARDQSTNTLTVTRASGQTVSYDAARLHGVSVYQPDERAFAPGDRIQFTAPSRELRVANRQLGTLETLEHGQATVRLDAGRTLTFRIADHPHVDLGYAVTSHSSQGLTADRVLVHVDSQRSAESIVNQRLAYVALSRGRHDAQIFTDNRGLLHHHLARDVSHRAAVEPSSLALT